MVSDRPHRPAMHRALALRELLDNAGSQFDAAVVTAFLRARPREPVPPRSGAARPNGTPTGARQPSRHAHAA